MSIQAFQEFCKRQPFFMPMVLFTLSAYFFSYIEEVSSFYWLLIFSFFALSCLFFRSYAFLLLLPALFFFGWYRLGLAASESERFRFLEEWQQEVVEISGMVYSIDALDMQREYRERRKVSFVMEVDDNQFFTKHFVKVFVQESPKQELLPGDRVRVTGRFFLPRGQSVPHTFDMQKYYRQNLWLGQLQLKSWDLCEVIDRPFHWRRYVYQGRHAIYQTLNRKLSFSTASLMSAIILGYTSDMDRALKSDFQIWGIAHIFSVSGLHLGLVGFWAWFCSGFFTLSLRRRTWTTIGVTFLYCLASGMSIATIRAFVMLFCFLAGYLVKRRASLWNNFAVAFVLLFLWDPSWVYTAGFQLSFLAVGGILITQRILKQIPPKTGVDLLLQNKFWDKYKGKLFEAFFYPMMISAATMGITAWHFQTVSFASIGLNFVIVPLFSILMGVSFFYFLILFFVPVFLFWPLEKIADIFLAIPQLLTGGYGLNTYVQTPPAHLVFVLFLIFCALSLYRSTIQRTFVLYLVYYVGMQIALLWQGQVKKDRLVMLDVGKASACFVQNELGENLLFDCGTVTGFDLISPYFKGEGINQFHHIFISHDHYDHISCWPGLLKHFTVKNIWRNVSHSGDSTEAIALNQEANRQKITLMNAYAGLRFQQSQAFTVSVLHPTPQFVGGKNEESIVLLLDIEWCEVLFTGDAQNIYQNLSRAPLEQKTKPRILIFPHHGRNIQNSELLIRWFQPDLILISGDTMTEDVKSVLTQEGIPWYITSQKGTMEITPNMVKRNFMNGQWEELP